MAAFKVKNLWTAFITAFFALLAAAGLTTAAAAAQQPAVQTPDRALRSALPKQARRQAVRATVPAPNTRWSPTARDRSLPPTIKQRIRAEAHGSSPATRHLSATDDDDELSSAADPVADPALAAA
ncbi:hypothetical protein HRW23_21350 [Streptomyces lunaelactis]|uniref:DUF6344 domain-containing protein n=1 Tax=Streptomyces lunaelactis TaxID=1535768 RepID=UPI001584923D|nr:DUF6344 domain-containing protein [Streptomyces lunaelactis]NUK04019.1 hypothetical protein [Streptomyces lunaelactis]NUK10960.1 hypothetical protein [Streptomyces lunaelactis]NUK18851.1 hypothetical protein [Streptomyces lunaelactis]NUK24512.1 hypothetical protein [Streptomyces lunaelactis]NUK37097.1 hypothetical protein [Streptomyces lunaelactis]